MSGSEPQTSLEIYQSMDKLEWEIVSDIAEEQHLGTVMKGKGYSLNGYSHGGVVYPWEGRRKENAAYILYEVRASKDVPVSDVYFILILRNDGSGQVIVYEPGA